MVTHIIDGDTIEISVTNEKKIVRLWGIDTPEWQQMYSGAAKNLLKKKILNHEIDIDPFYYDEYGRLVAMIYVGDENINQFMIAHGFAWVHSYFCNRKICDLWKEKERRARSERRGLWKQDNPTPPWQWKKR